MKREITEVSWNSVTISLNCTTFRRLAESSLKAEGKGVNRPSDKD